MLAIYPMHHAALMHIRYTQLTRGSHGAPTDLSGGDRSFLLRVRWLEQQLDRIFACRARFLRLARDSL